MAQTSCWPLWLLWIGGLTSLPRCSLAASPGAELHCRYFTPTLPHSHVCWAHVNQSVSYSLKVTVCFVSWIPIVIILLLLCLQQGGDRNASVEEEQAVLVLDMTDFIELILSVKTVWHIHFKIKHLTCTLWSFGCFYSFFLQTIDRREEESGEGSVTHPLLEGLHKEARKVVTVLLTDSLWVVDKFSETHVCLVCLSCTFCVLFFFYHSQQDSCSWWTCSIWNTTHKTGDGESGNRRSTFILDLLSWHDSKVAPQSSLFPFTEAFSLLPRFLCTSRSVKISHWFSWATGRRLLSMCALSPRPYQRGLWGTGPRWTDKANLHLMLPLSSAFLLFPDYWQSQQSCRSAWRVHGPVAFVWRDTDPGWSRCGGVSSSSWTEWALLWPLLWPPPIHLLSSCCRCATVIYLLFGIFLCTEAHYWSWGFVNCFLRDFRHTRAWPERQRGSDC